MNSAKILNHIIKNRRSIFPQQYTDDEIPENVLQEIVTSADYAPNHKRTYPWRLKIFKGEEKNNLKAELMRLYKESAQDAFSERKYNEIGEKADKSNAIITICINFSGKVPQWEEIAATAMAVQNMHLTCSVNDVGAYWGTPSFINKLKDFLKLEAQQECYGLFFMGKV